MRHKLVILVVFLGGLALGSLGVRFIARPAPARTEQKVASPRKQKVDEQPESEASTPTSSKPLMESPSPAPAPSPSTTEVVTAGKGTPARSDAVPPWAYERFRLLDRNGDGLLSEEEMTPNLRLEREKWDTNRDGQIDLTEFCAYVQAVTERQALRPGRGGNLARLPGGGQLLGQQRGQTEGKAGGAASTGSRKQGAGGAPAAPPAEGTRDVVVYRAGKLPENLPAWFTERDADGDGQVSLYEWKEHGGTLKEFRALDLNGDGFITVEELIRAGKLVVAARTAAAPPAAEAPPPEPPAAASSVGQVLDGKTVIADPGNMIAYRGQVGTSFYIEVTGKTGGGLWGTGTYTDDSAVATAAVHAGYIAVGQTAILKVRALPTEASYGGTTRFGITSSDFPQPFGGSYRIERVVR